MGSRSVAIATALVLALSADVTTADERLIAEDSGFAYRLEDRAANEDGAQYAWEIEARSTKAWYIDTITATYQCDGRAPETATVAIGMVIEPNKTIDGPPFTVCSGAAVGEVELVGVAFHEAGGEPVGNALTCPDGTRRSYLVQVFAFQRRSAVARITVPGRGTKTVNARDALWPQSIEQAVCGKGTTSEEGQHFVVEQVRDLIEWVEENAREGGGLQESEAGETGIGCATEAEDGKSCLYPFLKVGPPRG